GRRVQGEAARFAELDLLGHFAGPGFPVAPEVFPSTAFREPQGRQQRPDSSAYLLSRNRGVAQHESLRFRYSFDRRARIAGCLASGDRSGQALVLFPVSFSPYLLGPWPLRSVSSSILSRSPSRDPCRVPRRTCPFRSRPSPRR